MDHWGQIMRKGTGAILAVIALLLAGAAAYVFASKNGEELPAGFVQSNGRIEAEQTEIAPTLAGRVARVMAAKVTWLPRVMFWSK